MRTATQEDRYTGRQVHRRTATQENRYTGKLIHKRTVHRKTGKQKNSRTVQ
jgi:hypothetical protein